jgi:hypothetical protein
MTESKRRTDAFDSTLTDDQRWKLYDHLQASPWYEAAAWASKEFGIDPPGKNALYGFARFMRRRESERRIADALAAKKDMARSMSVVGDMDPELAHAWQQLAMESVLKGDPDAGKRYLDMAMELRKSALEKEKLHLKKDAENRAREALGLEREKFAEQQRKNADARKALEQVKTAGGITEDTLKKIEEALNLL